MNAVDQARQASLAAAVSAHRAGRLREAVAAYEALLQRAPNDADVLQLLAMGGKSGCLTLIVDDATGSIYFDNGQISFASLSERELGIGDVPSTANHGTKGGWRTLW